MPDMPEVAMDVKGLCERLIKINRDYDLSPGIHHEIKSAATIIAVLSRELAEARAERDEARGVAKRVFDMLTAAESSSASKDERIRELEAPVMVGELGRDDLRRRARALLQRNGWKPGDRFSAHSTIELMIALAIDAVQAPIDQCAYPECGCCHDATCTEATAIRARSTKEPT